MTKTRKILVIILSAIMALGLTLSVFALTGCGDSANELTSIKITTPPAKISYVSGEKFDATGMVVTAYYGKDDAEGVVIEQKTADKNGWTHDDPALTVPAGSFSATKSVTVTYEEDGVKKTAKQSVTVTKKVVELTAHLTKTEGEGDNAKEVPAYKNEYFAGQFFDPTGITVDAKFEDNTEEKGIVITRENANFSPDGALPGGTTEIVVSYGGKDFTVPVTLIPGVWIEAETGLMNGEFPNQASTNNGGNIGMDAALSNATANALALYRAQAKADFALTELKKTEGFDEEALKAKPSELYTSQQYFEGVTVNGEQINALYDAIVEWLGKNAEAVTAYLATDDYKAKEAAYVASDAYQTDINQYRANDDKYLGGVSQGTNVSFVFGSSGVGHGSISFRLASAYLSLTNGGANDWDPKVMGDVKLNDLAEVYINGAKYDIPDSAVLFGGMTPDGSVNGALWVNWQEVALDNVAFVEGRNVIELKIRHHGIIANGQTGYNWSCNVDSMYLKPADDAGCTLDVYDNTEEIDVSLAAKDIKVAVNDAKDKATLTVTGDVSVPENFKGYVADQVSATVQGSVDSVAMNIAIKDKTFTATADVTALGNDTYSIILEGEPAVKGASTTVDTTKVVVNTEFKDEFTLAVDEKTNAITLVKDAGVKADVIDAEFGQTKDDIYLEADGDKVYYVIKGKMESNIKGYEESNMEDAYSILAANIAKTIHFDLQGNPYMQSGSWTGDWANYVENKHVVTVTGGTEFKVSVDITSLPAYCFTTHADTSFHPATSHDFKPTGDSFEHKVTAGGMEYTMSFTKGGGNEAYYGCVGIKVVDTRSADLDDTTSITKTEDGKILLTVSGTYDGLTEEAFKANVKVDVEWASANNITEGAPDITFGTGTTVLDAEKVEVTFGTKEVTTGEGDNATTTTVKTFTIVADITDVPEGVYWAHVAGVKPAKMDISGAVASVETDSATYGFVSYTMSWDAKANLLTILNKKEETTDPTTPTDPVEGGEDNGEEETENA